jgi:vacuolar-type H+-ATPase subunit I/STV1
LSNPSTGSGIELKEQHHYSSLSSPAAPTEQSFRNFVCGVLPTDSVEQFKRMLYRISRGNALIRFAEIDDKIFDPVTGESGFKSVFWIVFLGNSLSPRIGKLCEILRATLYELPSAASASYSVLIQQLENELLEKHNINNRTEDSIVNLLQRLAYDGDHSVLKDWFFYQLHTVYCSVALVAFPLSQLS